MIYLSDDYITKYCDSLSYLIGRSFREGYSFDYIEKSIAYSLFASEFEKSNVTRIAFSSMEKLYSDVFQSKKNAYEFDAYDIFGWIGYTYIHLFLSLEITFEALFNLVSIEEMMGLYNLYHEMSFSQTQDYVLSIMKHSLLDVIMRRKKISNKELSIKTHLSVSTINALRYGNRDIRKLESDKLLSLSRELNIKMETLLPNIHLIKK